MGFVIFMISLLWVFWYLWIFPILFQAKIRWLFIWNHARKNLLFIQHLARHITLSDTYQNCPHISSQSLLSTTGNLSLMAVFRVVRRLKNNPRFCLKYLFLVNILCILCLSLKTESYNDILHREIDQKYQYQHRDQHGDVNSNHIFKDFQLEKWQEVDRVRLKDSTDSFFKWVKTI